jgi:hypothetical protein
MATHPSSLVGLGPIIQLGYVVTDLPAAIDRWADLFGAGPFFLFENVEFPEWRYRGVATPTPLDIAAGQLGEMVIELILPRGDGPSAYRDSFAAGTGGLHHFGVLANDPDAAARHFAPATPITSACTGAGTRFEYYDARTDLGAMVEIIEAGPDVRELFAMIGGAAKNWDGTDRIRPLAL